MSGFGRSSGFTLMEVGLAITVGAVLAAGGVMAYMHARDAAGDSVAKQKVADLQMMVEDYYTRYNMLPPLGGSVTNQGLRNMWALREDATKSPWTGFVLGSAQGVEGGDNPDPSSLTALPTRTPPRYVGGPNDLANCSSDPTRGEACGNRKDNLIYHRYQLPSDPPDPNGWNLWDVSLKSYVPVRGYAIAINKNYRAFYFVTSGRTAQQ